jgi:hypothetical protein
VSLDDNACESISAGIRKREEAAEAKATRERTFSVAFRQ